MSEGAKKSGEQPSSAARVAILGYTPEARDQALRLRALGWQVRVALRPGGMSWIRAVADGLRPMVASHAVAHSDVVVIHVPEAEQAMVWARSVAPNLQPGTLAVFAHGAALWSGVLEPDPRFDVVLVTRREDDAPGACRVAVHNDATGRALDRALGFARAAFGDSRVGTTTVASEVQSDLAELIERLGGVEALLAEWDRVLANPGHEPDEATLQYYERLRATVVDAGTSSEIARPPSSNIDLSRTSAAARSRGAA